MFQQMFGELLRDQGWAVEEGVRNSGEEVDHVLIRDDTFLLVECRWWSKRIEAKHVRDFAGKVRKRPGLYGVVVSMSGFTSGATEEAPAPDAPAVLFGPRDVERLFCRTSTFDTLLAEKKRTLVLHRRADWE